MDIISTTYTEKARESDTEDELSGVADSLQQSSRPEGSKVFKAVAFTTSQLFPNMSNRFERRSVS